MGLDRYDLDDVLIEISPTAIPVIGPDGGPWVLCREDELAMVRTFVSEHYDQGEVVVRPEGGVWFPVWRIVQ